jgi:hypothetical protein
MREGLRFEWLPEIQELLRLDRPSYVDRLVYGVRSSIYGSVYEQRVFIFYFASEPSAASPNLLRSMAKGSESSVDSVGPV